MAERLSTGFCDAVNAVGSVKSVMANGTIHIFVGTQPANADLSEAGYTLLMKITKDALALVPGVAANGINMDVSTAGVLAKAAAEIWKGLGLADGSAGWFRWYDNDVVTGDSTTAIRMDGSVGTSTTNELQVTNTAIVTDGPLTVNEFNFTVTKQ